MIVKTVGRSQDNNIVVNDVKVSRVHLQMVQDDNGNISVVDLNSANGTFVNGSRIASETRLKEGDEVRVGDTSLPWQSYFSVAKPQPAPSATPNPIPAQSKHNLKWIYLAGAVLLLMLVGGYFILHGNRKTEATGTQVEQVADEQQKQMMKQRLKEAEEAAAKANAEYAIALEKAKSAKSEKEREQLNREVAEKAKLVETASKNVNHLNAEISKLNAALADAQRNLSKKEQELSAANAQKDAAITAQKKAEADAANAKNKEADATREAKLTKEFYKLLNDIKDDKGTLKEVCKELEIPSSVQKDKGKMYKEIVSLFNNANNNDTRLKIVKALRGKTLKQSEKPESAASDDNNAKAQPTAQ